MHARSVSAPYRTSLVRVALTPEGVAMVLVTLLWLRVMAYLMVLSFTVSKRFEEVGAEVASSPQAEMAGRVFLALAIGFAAAALLWHIRRLTEPGLGRVALFVMPWLYLMLRDAAEGRMDLTSVPLLVVVLALAALRPGKATLRLLGVLVVITAAVSILMGLVVPDASILHEADGSVRQSDKALIPAGLLEGMFTAENSLAQYLSLGLPCVLLIGSRRWRLAGVAIVLFALIWSSSRGGLITAGAVLACAALFQVLRTVGLRRALAPITAAAVAGAVAVCVWLPLQPWPDDAFTARGSIWRVSIEEWLSNAATFGLGSDWYNQMGRNEASPLHGGAYHGHNEFVHLGVLGGLALVLLMALWVAGIVLVSLRADSGLQAVAALILIAVFTNGFFEVPLGFVDRAQTWSVSVVPLAIVFFSPRRRSAHPDDRWRVR